MNRRLSVLDGLRGISILFVLFYHIQKPLVLNALPYFLKPLFQLVFENGYLGVMFFFILSGFLTRSHYEKIAPFQFYLKRYYRLFPAFICAVFCMQVFIFFPTINLVLRILFIACSAALTIFLVKFIKNKSWGKIIFILFIVLQILSTFVYGYIIGRQSSNWFEMQTPLVRFISQLIVNSTLTVYLRNQIPILDGVYWTMFVEVIFILLYPICIAPFFDWLQQKKCLYHLIPLTIVLVVLLALKLASRSIHILSGTSVENLGYFFGGIYIADNKNRMLMSRYGKAIVMFFAHPFIILLFFWINQFICVPSNTNSILLAVIYKLLMIIPLTLIFTSLFIPKSFFSTLLNTKLLRFIGVVSYSLYLTHNGIMNGISLIIRPTTITNTYIFAFAVVIVSIFVGWMYHVIFNYKYSSR